MKKTFALMAGLFVAIGLRSQTLPYQNPELSPRERATDLLGRLTLEEKARIMLDISEAVPRLGIKKFNWWSEALHGVANQNDVTVFPEPIGMAASFDDDLLYRVFTATSDEMRAKYNDMMARGEEDQRFHSLSVWTPNVNIFRDPRWGRGQETYGEDPYLTSRMGVAVVKGLQGQADNTSSPYLKLYACAKHYAVHSGPEWARHTDNLTDVSARDLWETYMPAFKALVQKGDVREVMCAYQRLDDDPCCGNTRLLQQILRDEWGFKYMVVSDCGAVSDFWTSHKSSSDARHAAAKGVLAGTDVECGYDYAYKHLPEAVAQGLIKESDIDIHVQRLLEGRFELGEMDEPELVPWSKLPMSVVCCKEHRQLSLDMARQTMVLLQNKGDILPLGKKEKIAVIGPNADNETMLWGNYNGQPKSTVTILEGIRSKSKRVTYLRGCDLVHDQLLTSYYDQCSMDGKKGMKGTFWNNPKREGEPVCTNHSAQPVKVNTYGNYPFAPGVNLTAFSAKYETVFRPQQSGRVLISMEGCSYFELFVNGESKVRQRTWRTTPTRTEIDVEAGKEYSIEIMYAQVENWNANLKFDIGIETPIDYQDCIRRLGDATTVVFVGGISPALEGEEMPVSLPGFKGGDRTDIELPAVQRNFLKALHEAGKRVVFVNCSGSAMALLPETETCDAILQAWYAGEAGGQAVADVLFGDYNPQGKLPVTFYAKTEDLPDYRSYDMRGRTYRYTDKALFPFGYGLSYTRFEVGQAKRSAAGLVVPVTNTGRMAGTEVLQLYVRRDSDHNGPRRSLKDFQRVTLKPGETKEVEFSFSDETFELFDEKSNSMQSLPGDYTVFYGSSSADKDLKSVKLSR